MTKFEGFQVAFAVLGAGVFTYYTVRHGFPWVWAKVKSISRSIYEFVRGTKNKVVALEHRVVRLETQVQAHVIGHFDPAPVPVPPSEVQ